MEYHALVKRYWLIALLGTIFIVAVIGKPLYLHWTQKQATTQTADPVVTQLEVEPVASTTVSTTTEEAVVVAETVELVSEPVASTESAPESVAVAPTEPVPTTSTKPTAPAPEPVVETNSGVTAAHRAQILNGHNTVRSQKGLTSLSYSATVAASAQAWANTLATRGCPLTHSSGPYGENLYYSWTSANTHTLNPSDAVFWWLDEEQYYDYDANSCQAGEQCGHYTQAVWAETTQVGCGVSVCDKPGQLTQLWVCQYNPPGNDGTRPY